MKRGVVVVLGVQGKNNKVYGPDEKVIEENFPKGNFDELVKIGKIKQTFPKVKGSDISENNSEKPDLKPNNSSKDNK